MSNDNLTVNCPFFVQSPPDTPAAAHFIRTFEAFFWARKVPFVYFDTFLFLKTSRFLSLKWGAELRPSPLVVSDTYSDDDSVSCQLDVNKAKKQSCSFAISAEKPDLTLHTVEVVCVGSSGLNTTKRKASVFFDWILPTILSASYGPEEKSVIIEVFYNYSQVGKFLRTRMFDPIAEISIEG